MKAGELWLRCQKARIISWLNSGQYGATLPLNDGQYVIIAIYDNGRYVKPESVTVPNDVSALWGPDQPDGPAQYNKPPEEGGEESQDGTNDGG